MPAYPELAGIAVSIPLLQKELVGNADLLRASWADWPGDPEIDFDRLVKAIEDLAVYSERLCARAEEYKQIMSAVFEKPQRKLGAASARNVYFDRSMKNFFRKMVGQPHVEIVAILEQVTFDLSDSVSVDKVQKR